MPWELWIKNGTHRPSGDRVVVTGKNDDLGTALFFRGERITRAGNAPAPDITLESAPMDEIDLDDDSTAAT